MITEEQPTTARYLPLLDKMGAMFTTHRPGDWAYTSASPGAGQVTGFSWEEVEGRPAYEFFHPDDARAMKEQLIPAIRQHGNRTFRYRHRHRDGHYIWIESTHRSIRDPETGELLEIVTVSRDITLQVEAEQQTRKLAGVVEACQELVLFCTSNGYITYMNPAARSGMDSRNRERLHLSDLVDQNCYQKILLPALGTAATDGQWQGREEISQTDSQRRLVLQEVLRHDNDDIVDGGHFTLMIKDVTEQLQAEQRLNQSQTELAHVARVLSLGELATGLAHEINQPLATSLNYSQGALRQLDRDGQLPEKDLRRVLEAINRQGRRAADIIRKLRDLVRKTPYQRSPVSLNDVCREVSDLLQRPMADRHIAILLDLNEADVQVNGDRVQLIQVLANLVQNAADAYRQRNISQGQISLKTYVSRQHLLVEVMDQAGGIALSERSRLFDAFYTTKKEGLGMGLSISRTIIENHGGDISVESDGESWSRFTVRLPLI